MREERREERGGKRGERGEERGEERREERREKREEKRERKRKREEKERGGERGEGDDPDLRLRSGFAWGVLLSLHVRDTCLHSGSWLLSGFLLIARVFLELLVRMVSNIQHDFAVVTC